MTNHASGKRNNLNVLRRITTGLFLLLIALSYWFANAGLSFLNVNLEKLIAIFIASLIPIYFYLEYNLQKLNSGVSLNTKLLEQEKLVIEKFSDSFEYVDKEYRKFQKMRILASSSGNLEPMFRTSNFEVDECEVLLHRLNNCSNQIIKDRHNNLVDNQIVKWKDLKKMNRIKDLKIFEYKFFPTEYHVILDDKILLTGLYYPSDNPEKYIDFIQTWSRIENNCSENRLLISNYIERFDKLLADIKEKEEKK